MPLTPKPRKPRRSAKPKKLANLRQRYLTRTKNKASPEAEFQGWLIELCDELEIEICHYYDSRTCTTRGFPDCVITDGTHLLVLELKSAVGKPGINQPWWIQAFKNAGVEAWFAKPIDKPRIEKILRSWKSVSGVKSDND